MKRKKVFFITLLIFSMVISGVYYFHKPLTIISFKLKGYDHKVTPHFVILYKPHSQDEVPVVAKTAERAYKIVGDDFEYFPKGKTPIIVFPDRESIQRAFNWPKDENTQGVYYKDIIYIQSPGALIRDDDNLEETFFSKGPLIHEYTHLVVEHLTKGNCPRWFTEGVAQYEEQRVTGYTLEQDFPIDESYHYSVTEVMTQFDDLDDVAKAYLQALDMIKTMVGQDGVSEIKEIIALLKDGHLADELYLQRGSATS